MEENRKNPTPAEADAGEKETPAAGIDTARCASILESLLLVSTQPLGWERIGQLLGGLSRTQVGEVVAALRAKYPPDSSGILVEEVAKGVQLRTNPANQEYVRALYEARPARFTRPSLETLAVIAYKQPVTRAEIEQIRGVDCAASLKTLMDRRLIRVVGKKDVAGKPFLFGTSREFLEVFGLGGLSDLPSMRDIEDFLAAAAGGAAAPVQAPLFREEGVELADRDGHEIAEGLRETEHGEPFVAAPSDIPEGLSDDTLAGGAGVLGEGEAAEGVDARPAWEPGSTVRDIRRRGDPSGRAAVPPDALDEASGEFAGAFHDGEHAEPLVAAFTGLPAGVSDDLLAGAAAIEGAHAPEDPEDAAGGEPRKKGPDA